MEGWSWVVWGGWCARFGARVAIRAGVALGGSPQEVAYVGQGCPPSGYFCPANAPREGGRARRWVGGSQARRVRNITYGMVMDAPPPRHRLGLRGSVADSLGRPAAHDPRGRPRLTLPKCRAGMITHACAPSALASEARAGVHGVVRTVTRAAPRRRPVTARAPLDAPCLGSGDGATHERGAPK